MGQTAYPNILGALLGTVGKRPEVPTLPKLSAQDAQTQAISGNIASLPQIHELAASENKFNYDQIISMLKAVVPDFEAINKSASDVISSELRGEIPKDVQDLVQSSAAARALTGGYAGSGMHGNLVARDLGLTSLALTDKGLNSAERWLSFARSNLTPQLFNSASMFFTPQQQLGFNVEERNANWNVNWLRNQIKATPSPQQESFNEAMHWMEDTLRQWGMGAAMGGGGGMGGMMGGGGGVAPVNLTQADLTLGSR